MAENSGEVGPQPEFKISKEPLEGLESVREKAVEQRPQSEATASKKTPQFSPPTAAIQIPVSDGTTDPATSSKAAKPATSDLSAVDSDRIERQWVDRAKAIVAQTQDDPYTQKKQMSRIKADYIKKRFDKCIPADDAVAT